MKALILAGGKASRLRPISHTVAKSVLPVANTPIIHYTVKQLRQAGIVDIVVIISPETGEQVKECLGDGSKFGVNFTFVLQEQPLGLAHAVKVARAELGDDDFLLILGDNLIPGLDLRKVFPKSVPKNLLSDRSSINYYKYRATTKVLLKEVDNPQSFGIAELSESGEILSLEEKPKEPKSNLALVGVYGLTSAIHEAIDNIEPSWRNELEITDALKWLLKNGDPIEATILDTEWIDTGKKETLLEANHRILDLLDAPPVYSNKDGVRIQGRVLIGKNVVLRDCTIVGPTVIGDNSIVDNAYLGAYTAIGNGCVVCNTQVWDCILLDNSVIEGTPKPLCESLIGTRTGVFYDGKPPNFLRFNIGSDEKVEL